MPSNTATDPALADGQTTAAAATPAVDAATAATPAQAAKKPAARRRPAAAAPVKTGAPVKAAKPPKAGKPAKVTKAPSKPAAKKVSPSPKPAADLGKPAKAKEKLVRDSFTMPRSDFLLIQQLKDRAMTFHHAPKKSELLRAGLHALAGLSDATLEAQLKSLPALKSGRPRKTS